MFSGAVFLYIYGSFRGESNIYFLGKYSVKTKNGKIHRDTFNFIETKGVSKTMKKFLSIILAVAMIMSLFCMVSVSAASPAAGVYKAPYWFEDFENGTSPFAEKVATTNNPLTYTSEVLDTGDESRGMAAKMVVSGSVNDGASVQGEDSISVKVGDVITLSAWIKSEQALASKARLSFIFYPAETEGVVRGYHYWALDFDKNNTDWQYVTTTVVADWAGETGNISYRWGDTGGLNYSAADTEGAVNDRTYWVDDFELKIERPVVEEKAYPYSEVASVTPIDGSSWDGVTVAAHGNSDTETIATEEVVITPANEEAGTEAVTETNTFLRHTHASAGAIWYRINLKENMKAGHTYVLSFKNRVLGLPLADGTLDPAGPSGGTGFNYVNYQIRYPISDANAVTTWGSNSATNRYSSGKPYVDARWNGSNAAATDYTDWHTTTISFYSNKQNIAEDLSSASYIEVGTWLYNQNGSNLGTFDFDDFKVIDLGPLTNGGFDNSTAYTGLHDGGSSSTLTGASRKIAGWHFPGQHGSTQALQGGSRISTEQQTDKYGLLYYQLTEESEIYQYVPMHAYESYTIKGYVRGAKSGDAYTEGRARLVADFTGDTLAEEVYDVKSLGTNGVIYGDWVEFGSGYDLTKPVTLTVDLTNIGLIKDTTTAEDGSEVITSRVPTAGIIPKNAKVSVQFDEDWEGNVNAPNGGYHAVYMDGFTLTRNASAAPEAANITASMPEATGVVTAAYDFTTIGDAANASVYKVTGDGKTVVFYDAASIVVPEAMRSADDLQLTVVPVANGYFGEEVTADIEVIPAPAPDPVITLTQEDGDVTITTDTALVNAKLIFVSYDESGKMVECDIREPINIDANDSDVLGSILADSYETKAMLLSEAWKPLTAAIDW